MIYQNRNTMTPIKFIQVKENEIGFEVMTLVNMVSHEGQIIYFFVCEYEQTFKGITTIEKDLLDFSQEDFDNVISTSYKIA